MPAQRSLAACTTGPRSGMRAGECAVAIVIIVVAVIVRLRGVPLAHVTALLYSAGLLAVLVTRMGSLGVSRALRTVLCLLLAGQQQTER